MHMSIKILGGAAVLGATMLVTQQVVSQQQEAQMDEMMARWMELANPGPEHAKLARMAGAWNQKSTHWAYPGAEPSVSDGTATYEPIMGGRFLLERVESKMNFGGQEVDFEGMAIIGYDNLAEKHFYAWIDSLGTMLMLGEGQEIANGDVVYYSELPNPMGPGTMKMKSVNRIVDNNHIMFDMFYQQEDGQWFKNMAVEAARADKSQKNLGNTAPAVGRKSAGG